MALHLVRAHVETTNEELIVGVVEANGWEDAEKKLGMNSLEKRQKTGFRLYIHSTPKKILTDESSLSAELHKLGL